MHDVTHEALAPVVENLAPTTVVSYTALALVVDYIAPAVAVTYAEHAPVAEHIAVTFTAAPVDEYVAPAPAVLQHTHWRRMFMSLCSRWWSLNALRNRSLTCR